MSRRTLTAAAFGLALLLPAALWAVKLGRAADTQDAPPNQLTDDEKKAGWKLLFDGKSFDGWASFKRDKIRPGWKVQDGTLACTDPHQAGDLATTDKYDWYELSVDYNISEGGNSGIMFHVTNDGNAIWLTGPEIQLEDNKKAADPIRCGWMYQLYQPPADPATGKPLDATKPVGEWNTVRLLLAPPPAQSEVDVNGVKYYDFVFNSEDFKSRVAKSKFKDLPHFAPMEAGFIGLQGDHGAVAFRNIKLRPIKAEGK